jgi:hypothetical protein
MQGNDAFLDIGFPPNWDIYAVFAFTSWAIPILKATIRKLITGK